MNTTNEPLQLETFLLENQPHLESIRESLNAFNIFNVLRIQHREIRHSNFLGWLFDPNESHQLGDRFLKDLLELIRNKVIKSGQIIPPLLNDLSGTRVARESEHNIDLLIVNEALSFVICIENKIHAAFSPHQLKKYYDYVKQQYSHVNTRIYLTLTPFSSSQHLERETGEKYSNITYFDILKILNKHTTAIENALPTVRESIKQYITMVEQSVTHSGQEVKLAQEIYKKYKREIDFIVKNQHRFKDYKALIEKAISTGEMGEFDVIKNQHHGYVLRFLPKEIKSTFVDNRFQSWDAEYFFCLELILEDENISLKWGFGNIRPKEKELRALLQERKTQLFQKMRDLPSMKRTDGLFKQHTMNAEQDYPGVGYVQFFNFEAYLNQPKDFMDFFKDTFERVNKEVIQPWIIDCKAVNWA